MVEKLICLHNEIQLVTKINTFFIVFHIDDDEHGLKIKNEKNSFQILVHIRICNFFLSISFFFFSTASLLHLWKSLHRQRGALPSAHLSIRLSVCPSAHSRLWTSCVECLLPVPVSCFRSVSGRGHGRKREQYAGQAGTVIWLCTHSWSVHVFQQTAALFPKVQYTHRSV